MSWEYSLISYLFVGLPLLAIILMRKRSNSEKRSQISPQNAYQIALDEVQNNEVQEGLWAEAYAHSQDEESRKKYQNSLRHALPRKSFQFFKTDVTACFIFIKIPH